MLQVDQNQTNFSMNDFKKYFYLFWSWLWLILLAGLLAGGVAYYISIRTTPIYQSSTKLLVSNPSNLGALDTTSLVADYNMTGTYEKMLTDRPVLQGVIDKLKLSMSPDELQGSISVANVQDTQLLVVSVSDTSPTRAADIANAIGDVFSARVRELQAQRYTASLTGLEQQVNDMEQQVTSTKKTIAATTDANTLAQLQDQLTQYQDIYTNLVTNYEQVRLAAVQTGTDVVVSEPATASTVPVSPKTNVNTILAVVVGMLLAAGAVFLVDTIDDTIKDPFVIHNKFNLPTLGVITSHKEKDGKPISLTEPRSPVAEAFRSLRTNIIYSGVDTALHRIMVTSGSPKEGKTTIAANLAVTLAQGEVAIVLIDADFRRPAIHHKFGMHNRVGLSDMFLPNPPVQVVRTVKGSSLAVITSGALPPNPTDLLTSKKMKQLLDLMGKRCEMILLDTPPILSVTDGYAMAPGMDGVILVVRPGVTKMGEFQQAVAKLRGVNAHILGVVYNRVSPRSRTFGNYYYYHHDGKKDTYYDKEQGKKKKKRVEDEPGDE
jgi:succinoglycan biosynthesis transport protein ExoP